MRIIEFIGIPGVGKTFLAEEFVLYCKESQTAGSVYCPQYKIEIIAAMSRIGTKIWHVFGFVTLNPGLALSAIKVFSRVNIKLIFNTWFYCASVLRGRKFDTVIFDQGIGQLVWSSQFRGIQVDVGQLKLLLSRLFSTANVSHFSILHIVAPIDQHHERLAARKVGHSPIEDAPASQLESLQRSVNKALECLPLSGRFSFGLEVKKITVCNKKESSSESRRNTWRSLL